MGGPPRFAADVARVLEALEPGHLVTYGEVAVEAGWPGRARAVGRLLADDDGRWPWWRVVTASGRLVPGLEAEQAQRLRSEGVEVDEAAGRVRRPRRSVLRKPGPGAMLAPHRTGGHP
ncbi:MAG: MGMT family protein [Actinobacteria bacterium]|nr:MGMT family protein [Actinomycetota bacterium]